MTINDAVHSDHFGANVWVNYPIKDGFKFIDFKGERWMLVRQTYN